MLIRNLNQTTPRIRWQSKLLTLKFCQLFTTLFGGSYFYFYFVCKANDLYCVSFNISIEKDPTDNAAKQRESQDCSQKVRNSVLIFTSLYVTRSESGKVFICETTLQVLELQKRIDSARNQIKQLPGIDYNIEEQLQRLETLRNQLTLKQELIKKYKNTPF